VTIEFRRGNLADWLASSEVLAAGQPGLAIDTGEVRYGNGSDVWANLPTRRGALGGLAALDASGQVLDGSGTPVTGGSGGSGGTPGTGSVGTTQLAPGAVTNAKVADGAVTDAKVATGISADKLVSGTTNKVYTATEQTKVAKVPADTTAALAGKTDPAALAAALTALASGGGGYGFTIYAARTAAQGVPTPAQCAAAGYPDGVFFTVDPA
jgi:hypothetical protein